VRAKCGFQTLSAELAALIRQQYGIPNEQQPGNKSGVEARIPSGTQPFGPAHSLDEDFTFTRPIAFTLGNLTVKDVPTWSDLYAAICRHLAQRDPSRFAKLPDDPQFTTAQDRRMFGRDPRGYKRSPFISQGIYADTNISANNTCDMIKKVLAFFGIEPESLKIYLRLERPADDVAAAPA
jgi:hypothetical protein